MGLRGAFRERVVEFVRRIKEREKLPWRFPYIFEGGNTSCSNVWHVETIIGSTMSDLKIGQMNSVGGFAFHMLSLLLVKFHL